MKLKVKKEKRILHIAIGIAIFALAYFILPETLFTYGSKIAFATLFLMIYWWITRPFHIAVTALMPIIVNSIFAVLPMADVLKNYASQIVVLLLGANILTITWKNTGLDRKIALKALGVIGTSFKLQLIVWFLLSAFMSAVLPNAVVAAALCPIAAAMMLYADGAQSTQSIKMRDTIFLMIVWGAGIGGFGTPLGGAMNLVAISYIEKFIGREFMFIEWVVKMMPYLAVILAGISVYILLSKTEVKRLPGTGEYFKSEYKKSGKMTHAQKTALVLFLLPVVLSFARPLYADVLPELKPYFTFLIFSVVAFILKSDDGERMIEWNRAQKDINWGLMILFSGGLAIGSMLTQTGALQTVSEAVSSADITKILPVVIVIVAFSMFLSNASSNTAAVAVAVPLVLGIASVINVEPLRFVYLTAAACNCAFLLPTSIRAIPVGYGLDTDFMLKKGFAGVAVTFLALVAAGCIAIII